MIAPSYLVLFTTLMIAVDARCVDFTNRVVLTNGWLFSVVDDRWMHSLDLPPPLELDGRILLPFLRNIQGRESVLLQRVGLPLDIKIYTDEGGAAKITLEGASNLTSYPKILQRKDRERLKYYPVPKGSVSILAEMHLDRLFSLDPHVSYNMECRFKSWISTNGYYQVQ